MKRIGLFGGTFDPIHRGHLQLAEGARVRCSLDKVIFLPAAVPPHKEVSNVTPFEHRAEMLALALAKWPEFSMDLIEKELPFPSYTIDTVSSIIKREAKECDFYFITGTDTFLEITTWKDYNKLLASIHFIVFPRAGYKQSDFERFLSGLGYFSDKSTWRQKGSGKMVFFINQKIIDVSSSSVRRIFSQGGSLEGCVPSTVVKYIQRHQLYKKSR